MCIRWWQITWVVLVPITIHTPSFINAAHTELWIFAFFVISQSEQICKWGVKYAHSMTTDHVGSTCIPHYPHTKFDTILDGLRVIPENIGWATCRKNIGRREAESDIFHTCSESNIFRYHPKEAIQYLHYYVSESDLNKCMKRKHLPCKWFKIPIPSPIVTVTVTVQIQQFNKFRIQIQCSTPTTQRRN